MNNEVFDKMNINWKKSTSVKETTRDADAHYDIDGVSISSDGVVVSGDNQTTEGAPTKQHRIAKPVVKKINHMSAQESQK